MNPLELQVLMALSAVPENGLGAWTFDRTSGRLDAADTGRPVTTVALDSHRAASGGARRPATRQA
jgi:hypothetical protein